MKWAFRHIHEYYSLQNISTIKYLFVKKCLENYDDNFQENVSRPGINDVATRYRVAARRFRNTALEHSGYYV